MRVIVFGGSGFLGSFVADFLSEARHEVVIFDLLPSPYLKEGQRMIVGNILDRPTVEAAIQGADAVYNFAGVSDINFSKNLPYETLYTNVVGNLNILESCRLHRVNQFLFASTLYVYSKAGAFYRVSKQSCELAIESYAERYGFKYTILRYGSLYGPRANAGNWVYHIISQALTEGKMVRMGDGLEIREYIHVVDAARLSIKAMQKQFENSYVIIAGNQFMKIKDFMAMVKEMLGAHITLEFQPEMDDQVHYEITPYHFRPKLAVRIEDSTYIDLGQGVLDLIYTIAGEQAKEGLEFDHPLKLSP